MLRKIKNVLGKIFYFNDFDYNKSFPESNENNIYEELIPELPKELTSELEKDLYGELHVLEINNDDITPMDYVVTIIKKISKRKDYQQSCELMLKIHNEGSAQLLAGEKDIMEAIMEHIVNDARSRKFPLKLNVVKA